MSKRFALEREKSIDEILKQRLSPISKEELAEILGVDTRTIQRDIKNLRDFYFLPVKNQKGFGYFYDDADKKLEFPKINQKLSDSEIQALILAYRLATTIPEPALKKHIRRIFDKITHFIDFDLIIMEKRISLKNVRYYKVDPVIFETVCRTLRNSKKIKIEYQSNHNMMESNRVIQPLHLIIYMGNWHLLAYCDFKKDTRVFTLSRIKKLEELKQKLDINIPEKAIKDLIHRNYGIFLGRKQTTVKLKFSGEVNGIVRDQVWCLDQKKTEHENGEITLELKVADYREIKGDILSFGENVEVIEPIELRKLITQTLQKMQAVYSQGVKSTFDSSHQ